MNPLRAAPDSGRLRGLDALRGVAVLSVMAYHYTAWYGYGTGGHIPPGVSLILDLGGFGVDLFFLISGFVIAMSFAHTRSMTDFLMLRIVRLFPAFFVSIAFTLGAQNILGDPGGSHGLGFLAANLTMVPEWFNEGCVDGSYWSLKYELTFYLLAGFIFRSQQPRHVEAVCAIWLLISVVAGWLGPELVSPLVPRFLATGFAHLFVIGIMLYRLHGGNWSAWTWIVLAAALERTIPGPHSAFGSISVLGYFGLVMVFAVLVWGAATQAGRVLAIAPLRFIGTISYPLYLIHAAAGFALIARLEAAGFTPDHAVVVTAICAIAAAWGISSGVEQPVRTWYRGRYKNRVAGPAHAAVPPPSWQVEQASG